MAGDTPHGVPGLSETDGAEEIDLLEYWAVLWRRRWMIVGVALLCAGLGAAVSLLLPNVYRAETLLSPVEQEGAGLSGGLLGGLGGLGALAGVMPGGGGGVDEHLAVLKSREFIWAFVRERQLLPVLFAEDWEKDPAERPDMWDAYRLLINKGTLSVSSDRKSGLVTVAVEWTDPELAADWANDLVTRLNAYLRQRQITRSQENLAYLDRELRATQVEEMRQALFELISSEQKKAMLARTQKEFAFQVLDPAAPPDIKAKPKRALIVVLAGVVGGMAAVVLAFILEALARRRLGV